MAQVTISHIRDIAMGDATKFAQQAHSIVGIEVHGINNPADPSAVTVLTLNMWREACISGADTEVQVLISGNDWPRYDDSTLYSYLEAKQHFDEMAGHIFKSLGSLTDRRLYVWVTPYVASGWAE